MSTLFGEKIKNFISKLSLLFFLNLFLFSLYLFIIWITIVLN